MESNQFETLMLAITGLKTEMKTEISGLRAEIKTEINRLEAKVDVGFAEVRKDIAAMREQTGKTHVEVTNLKSRVSRIEGPQS